MSDKDEEFARALAARFGPVMADVVGREVIATISEETRRRLGEAVAARLIERICDRNDYEMRRSLDSVAYKILQDAINEPELEAKVKTLARQIVAERYQESVGRVVTETLDRIRNKLSSEMHAAIEKAGRLVPW